MRNFLYFLILCSFVFAGCVTHEYNPVTGKEDTMLFSTEKEIEMGRKIAKSLEENPDVKLDPDPLMTHRVAGIGKKVAAVSDRQEVSYSFKVIDREEPNAFALPGGYIYLFKGLVDMVDSDDEIASVIAHEIAHVVARHSMKRLQGGLGYTVLQVLMAVSGTGATDMRKIDSALGQLVMTYSREDEALADRIAIRYLKESGYDPYAMLTFLEKMKEEHKKMPIKPYMNYRYRSHPTIADRIRMVKQALTGEVDFSDYMNKPVE